MNRHIDFYFDIISAYSYIAHKKILKINKTDNIKFNYKPVLLGGLHKLVEITPPAFNKFKMKNMKNDCELIAKKNNIDFQWNNKFPINSVYIMRGYIFVNDKQKMDYLNNFFDAYWKNNIDLSIQSNIEKILKVLRINNDNFFNGINQQSIKDRLKNFTNKAFLKEVFGAPTFIVNNKIFWGQDRLEYAVDELNSY